MEEDGNFCVGSSAVSTSSWLISGRYGSGLGRAAFLVDVMLRCHHLVLELPA